MDEGWQPPDERDRELYSLTRKRFGLVLEESRSDPKRLSLFQRLTDGASAEGGPGYCEVLASELFERLLGHVRTIAQETLLQQSGDGRSRRRESRGSLRP